MDSVQSQLMRSGIVTLTGKFAIKRRSKLVDALNGAFPLLTMEDGESFVSIGRTDHHFNTSYKCLEFHFDENDTLTHTDECF